MWSFDSPPCHARAKANAGWVLKMPDPWVLDQRGNVPVSSHPVRERRWPLPGHLSSAFSLLRSFLLWDAQGLRWCICSAHRMTRFPLVYLGCRFFQKWVTILLCVCTWTYAVCLHTSMYVYACSRHVCVCRLKCWDYLKHSQASWRSHS